MEARVETGARHEAIRRISIAALGSLALGLVVGMGYLTAHLDTRAALDTAVAPAPAPAPEAAAQPAAPEPAAAQAPAAPTANIATRPGEHPGLDPNPDDATLALYQKELARKVAAHSGVTSAFWLTRQTLAVNRSAELEDAWPVICSEVTRYAALRTVRVQLNPRPGVDEPVRWRQCATL